MPTRGIYSDVTLPYHGGWRVPRVSHALSVLPASACGSSRSIGSSSSFRQTIQYEYWAQLKTTPRLDEEFKQSALARFPFEHSLRCILPNDIHKRKREWRSVEAVSGSFLFLCLAIIDP